MRRRADGILRVREAFRNCGLARAPECFHLFDVGFVRSAVGGHHRSRAIAANDLSVNGAIARAVNADVARLRACACSKIAAGLVWA